MEFEQTVTIDADKCTRCGVCIARFKDYCISEDNGLPVIDYRICNICQKCAALCPSQAILINSTAPEKITGKQALKSADLLELLSRRRSIKIFKDKKIPEDVLQSIIDIGKYAPNQNKNIDAKVITERELLEYVDQQAFKVFTRIYRLLKIFSRNLPVIKKKMEYDLITRKMIMKQGTQAMILLVGDRKVPVTEMSAQYLLATKHIYAYSLGVGSCLMDSVKIALNLNARPRKKLNIPRGFKVLGVIALGYPDEKIVNTPRGYELNVRWN